jgi:preprotein translocase subunit YajC
MDLFGSDSIWPIIIFTVVLFGLFYLLAIRPQRKRQKQHQSMLADLQKGTHVITAGGIHGTIESLDEETIVLRVESGATLRFARGSIVAKSGE